jgi:hypothetical protein
MRASLGLLENKTMDIIRVTKNNVKAELEEAVFEINSCLARPQEKGSVGDFHEAVRNYTLQSGMLSALQKLESQIEESKEEEELENNES